MTRSRLPNRLESNTAKVKTPFGSAFIAVEHIGGRVQSLAIQHPQKFEDTEIGKLLEQTFAALNSEIENIVRRWEGQ